MLRSQSVIPGEVGSALHVPSLVASAAVAFASCKYMWCATPLTSVATTLRALKLDHSPVE